MRKKRQSAASADLAISSAAFDTVAADLESDLERFGDGVPYERNRVAAEFRFYMAHTAQAMFEAGKRLILIRDHESADDFAALLEGFGVSDRTARRWMAATRRLASVPEKARQALSAVPQSKLIALFDECSDDALIDLAEGKSIAGLTLAEIGGLSVRELAAKLADMKAVADARQKVIERKQERVASLERQLEKVFEPGPESLAKTREQQAQIESLRSYLVTAETALFQLATFANEVQGQALDTALQLAARQGIEYMAQRVADLVNTHGIQVDVSTFFTLSQVGSKN